jgi:hypothetical protein
MADRVTVDEFITDAIMEGVRRVPYLFMENLENELRKDVIISEAGNAENYLQYLIDETASSIQ